MSLIGGARSSLEIRGGHALQNRERTRNASLIAVAKKLRNTAFKIAAALKAKGQ